ncbi:MAG: dihydroorotate dehydrogenase (quinone), partial [Marinovum sp.]|nr:dihydroorotate dehydrogenase (quinone) [Marinovum sp.]
MNLSEKVALRLLSNLDPEKAHNLAIRALKFGFIPKTQGFQAKSLELSVAGLKFKNPLGLAAGFDKNAEAIKPLLEFGFGFIEVGAVTPLAQIGNPKPRLFRLKEDSAIINRFGFNNDGMHEVSKRLSKRPSNGIVGLNLGANKNSADRINDFATVFKTCSEFIDFATVNVSSPNTENLRKLQSDKELRKLLNEVSAGQDDLKTKVPVFLKIAPDLEQEELKNIALVA